MSDRCPYAEKDCALACYAPGCKRDCECHPDRAATLAEEKRKAVEYAAESDRLWKSRRAARAADPYNGVRIISPREERGDGPWTYAPRSEEEKRIAEEKAALRESQIRVCPLCGLRDVLVIFEGQECCPSCYEGIAE